MSFIQRSIRYLGSNLKGKDNRFKRLCFSSNAAFALQQPDIVTPFSPGSMNVIPSTPALVGLEPDGLILKISNNEQYTLSHHQLRENCRCDLCCIKPSRHRNVSQSHNVLYNESINPISITFAGIDNLNKFIYLKWSDGHNGWIDLEELLNEDDDNAWISQQFPFNMWKNNPDITEYEYNDIMVNDDLLLNSFYNELDQNGLCLIVNSTPNEGTVKAISERLANHIYPTVFGPTFIVDIKPNPDNPAYTNLDLPSHTDLPYYGLVPDYFVFHCIINNSTGNSIYNDGFCIAEEMRKHYPDQFEILTKISVPFRDHQKGKWDFIGYKKIIELNEENPQIIDKITYNEGVRSSIHWKIDNKIKKDFYYALSIFSSMVQDKEFTFERQLESGNIMIFNNTRILHGRRSFDGQRKMEGCFFSKHALKANKKQIQFKLKYLMDQSD